jgi:phage terminase large subunit-like protein
MSDNAELTRAAEALHTAILHDDCPHNGNPILERHVLNARRRPNRWGVSFGKEHRESGRKIDALSALVLARMMRQRVRAVAEPEPKRRTGALYAF